MIRVSSKTLSRFASMLDLGGIHLPTVNTRIDVSKNHKVRAIAFDFELISKSVITTAVTGEKEKEISSRTLNHSSVSNNNNNPSAILPEHLREKIDSISQVLQFKRISSNSTMTRRREDSMMDDDITRIVRSTDPSFSSTVSSTPSTTTNTSATAATSSTSTTASLSSSHVVGDIRTKYASKLRSKVEGGIPAIENMKYQRETAMKRGDASTHLYARKEALTASSSSSSAAATSNSNTKWIATNSGTGKLLQFLHHRSMMIAFIPPLVTVPNTTSTHPSSSSSSSSFLQERLMDIQQRMKDLCQQLPQIHIDYTISGLELFIKDKTTTNDDYVSSSSQEWAKHIVQYFYYQITTTHHDNINNNNHTIHPNAIILVSERDEYLKVGKDMGMMTCRVQPLGPNSPRGNVTTHYRIQKLSQVEDVINEINGISFNTVLSTTTSLGGGGR